MIASTTRHVGLVVDDDPTLLGQVVDIVESLGHRAVRATCQQEAEDLLIKQRVCYVLLDLALPLRSGGLARRECGLNLLRHVRNAFGTTTGIIAMTAYGNSHELPVRAFKAGADDYLKKPFEEEVESPDKKILDIVAKRCEAQHRHCPNACCLTSPQGDAKPAIKIHFVGTCRRRRHRLLINGQEMWLAPQNFSLLWQLAASRRNGHASLHLEEMHGVQSGAHQALHRLRKALDRFDEGLAESLITSDGHGRYGLALTSSNVTFDRATMTSETPDLLALLKMRS